MKEHCPLNAEGLIPGGEQMAMSSSMRRELRQLRPFVWLFGVCLLALWSLGHYPTLATIFFRVLEYGSIVLMYFWTPCWLIWILFRLVSWMIEPNTPTSTPKEKPDISP
jgi:hypothetical protein